MAKFNKTNTTNTTPNDEIPVGLNPDTTEAEAAETVITVTEGITVFNPGEQTALSVPAPVDPAKAWMQDIPKPIRMMFELAPPVEPEEMTAMIEQLPDGLRTNLEDAIAKMNPVKMGIVSSDTRFQIFDARIYHGVGDDPGRPGAAPVGSVYTADGRVLACWSKVDAARLKTGQTFVAAVVGLQETRSWWKPRDKNYALPIDVDPNSKAPICVSLDRKRGKRYGACPACPHRPYANGKYDGNSCHDEVKIYFVLRDFSGIYAMTLKGASVKNGVGPIRRLINTSTAPWDRWFEIGIAEERNNDGRWFSLTGGAHTDDDHPQGLTTTPQERGVLAALSRTVLNEVYKPALQSIYAQNSSAPVVADVAADMSAITRAALGEATPDYSQNNL